MDFVGHPYHGIYIPMKYDLISFLIFVHTFPIALRISYPWNYVPTNPLNCMDNQTLIP
jgi:hypothetical protein